MPSRPLKEMIAGREFVCVGAELPVREVSRRMRALERSAALVTEHGALVGIFTERDASFRVLAAGLDPDTTPVGAVMTHKPQTLSADKPFGHALHLMYEGGYRHMPVVDSRHRPLGVVSARDALALDAFDFGAELQRREEIAVIL